VPAGVRVLDLKGKHVLPGLIDAHTHADNFTAFRRALESGVTTVRTAGLFVPGYADVGFQQLVKSGAVIGPDVVTAGYQIRPQMQEEAFLVNPQYADLMSGLNTIEKLRRAVQMNLAHGVDWIKILATPSGTTASRRRQNFTEEEIRAIVDEAAAKGVPVAAHVHSDDAAMAAVKAGVRSIEHGDGLSDATLSLMKTNGVYLDPTYTVVWFAAEPGGDPRAAAFGTAPDPAIRLQALHILPQHRETIQRAHKMKLKIVTGTDLNYGPNALPRVSQEMAHFVEMGFTARGNSGRDHRQRRNAAAGEIHRPARGGVQGASPRGGEESPRGHHHGPGSAPRDQQRKSRRGSAELRAFYNTERQAIDRQRLHTVYPLQLIENE
jgi:imidazolonepropionase-like amidohydrolase